MRKILGMCPILPAAVGIVVGIPAYEFLPLWVCLPVLAVSCLFFIKHWPWTAATGLFVAVGMLLCALLRPGAPPDDIFHHKVTASAKVLTVEENPLSLSLLVKVDSIQQTPVSPFKAQLTVNSLSPDLEPGMRVHFTTAFSPLPGKSLLPGDTDLSLYYKSEGISALAYCNDSDCRIVAPATGIENFFTRTRKHLALTLLSTSLTDNCKTFLLATLLGDDAFLAPVTKDTFRRAGVSHLLALSGLHVGIIVVIVMMLSLPLNASRHGFYIRPVIAIVFVWCYAMLVGLPPSVVRAAIMTTVYMLARLIQRGHTGLNSLIISVVFILAIKPLWLYSIGFQLSIAAVASILAFTSLVPRKWHKYPVRHFLLMSVIVPVSAMLGTGIITALHFSSFPLLFLPSNIAVGLFAPWIIGFGAAILIFALCGWQLTVMAWLTSRLYALMTAIITFFGEIPEAEITGCDLPALAFLPYAAAVVFLWFAISRKSWRWGLSSIVSFLLTGLVAITFTTPRPDSELFILPDKDATKIILYTSGTPALILPDAKVDTEEVLRKTNRQHLGYLSLRSDAESFFLRPTPRRITINGTALRMISEASDTTTDTTPPTYLLICSGFSGNTPQIWRKLRPDTILLSPALSPRTSKRIIKECGDSIPVKNLRGSGIKISTPSINSEHKY